MMIAHEQVTPTRGGDDVEMRNDEVVAWMVAALKHGNMTYAAASRALGLPQDAVSKIVKGRRDLSAAEMTALSEMLNFPLPRQPNEAVRTAKVIYVLSGAAAGHWIEVGVATFEPYELTTLPATEWPEEAQFGVVIEGDNVNLIARNGDHALCLAAAAAPRGPQAGDWVLVDRFRDGLRERTIRRVEMSDSGEIMLCHASTDERYADVLTPGIQGSDNVEISAFVLDFLRGATRF